MPLAGWDLRARRRRPRAVWNGHRDLPMAAAAAAIAACRISGYHSRSLWAGEKKEGDEKKEEKEIDTCGLAAGLWRLGQ